MSLSVCTIVIRVKKYLDFLEIYKNKNYIKNCYYYVVYLPRLFNGHLLCVVSYHIVKIDAYVNIIWIVKSSPKTKKKAS